MGPLLPCASVAAGGGPVSQLLRFALGLLRFGAVVNKAFGVGFEARPRVPGVAGAALPLSCAVFGVGKVEGVASFPPLFRAEVPTINPKP
jgi:hypothetical protein